jgi:hypothetical protein
MEVWIGPISVVIGAFMRTTTTLITTRRQMELEQRVALDRGLRPLRFPHYQAPHSASECIPRQWRPGQ